MEKENKNQKKIVYYTDEVNDDFGPGKNKTNNNIVIDEKYNYLPKGKIASVAGTVLYYGIALPFLYAGTLFKHKVKIYGKEKLKALKNTGYVLYGNHSNAFDAYLGAVRVASPKRTYVISTKEVFDVQIAKYFVKPLGALPLPSTITAMKNFNLAISSILKKKRAIVVYPEAHVWPYATRLRPFPVASFKLAVSNNVPAVPFAVTYRKPEKPRKKPGVNVHIGDPIYPQAHLDKNENSTFLRDKTVEFIKSKVESPDNYMFIEYIKKQTGA